MFLDYEWRGRALRGNTCDSGGEVWPRMQYGSQEKPSDVEETFGTLCHPLNLFAVGGVFDLEKQTMLTDALCLLILNILGCKKADRYDGDNDVK